MTAPSEREASFGVDQTIHNAAQIAHESRREGPRALDRRILPESGDMQGVLDYLNAAFTDPDMASLMGISSLGVVLVQEPLFFEDDNFTFTVGLRSNPDTNKLERLHAGAKPPFQIEISAASKDFQTRLTPQEVARFNRLRNEFLTPEGIDEGEWIVRKSPSTIYARRELVGLDFTRGGHDDRYETPIGKSRMRSLFFNEVDARLARARKSLEEKKLSKN